MELRVVSNGTLLSRKIAEALIETGVQVLSVSIDAMSRDTYGQVRGAAERYDEVVDNVSTFLDCRQRQGARFPLLRVSFVKQPANRHEADEFVRFWSKRADMVDVQTYHDYRTRQPGDDFVCSEPWRRLMVMADGRVAPCCGLPGIVLEMGRIGEQTLAEIWQGERLAAIRSQLAAARFPDACRRCQGSRVEL